MISFVLILVFKYWHILVWTYVFKCDQMKWYKMTHLAGAPEAKGCELKVIAMLEYTWEQEYKSAWVCEYSTAVSENKSTWETVFSFAWATLYVQLYSYTHLCAIVSVHASVWLRTVQGCISCGILVSGIGARGVSSEHMENMEMFSCSPT